MHTLSYADQFLEGKEAIRVLEENKVKNNGVSTQKKRKKEKERNNRF